MSGYLEELQWRKVYPAPGGHQRFEVLVQRFMVESNQNRQWSPFRTKKIEPFTHTDRSGATGKTGSVAVTELLKAGYPVRAIWSTEKMAAARG